MESPTPQQPVGPYYAVWTVLRRWHPEGFAAAGIDQVGIDQSVAEIDSVARRWGDADILAPYLLALERQARLQPKGEAAIQGVVAELLGLELDAGVDIDPQGGGSHVE